MGWDNDNYSLWKWAWKKSSDLFLMIQLTLHYSTRNTNLWNQIVIVIVFATYAILDGVRKTSSLLAQWPPSRLPSLLAALKSPAKQNKLLLLSRNNTLMSPSKKRISCSCCSDSAACSEQQEENKEEEVREEGRGGSPALTHPLLLVLLPQLWRCGAAPAPAPGAGVHP